VAPLPVGKGGKDRNISFSCKKILKKHF